MLFSGFRQVLRVIWSRVR